jgi:hypothetical protein
MADWVTISSLATAGGTLVLALATFSSVKSANRSARVAERSLLAGLAPVLIPSREDDPAEWVRFGDQQVVTVPGHGGNAVVGDRVIYLALGLRNGGAGLAVIHGWHAERRSATPNTDQAPGLDRFRTQQIDLYIPAGDSGYWLGALRDPSDPDFAVVREALESDELLQVDLLYGDHEGGQRTIVRFAMSPWPEQESQRATAVRYWNVDREDPRGQRSSPSSSASSDPPSSSEPRPSPAEP